MKFIQLIEQLFADFGYWVLLLGLPLDAIALPLPPGNTTLTYTGYLAYKGILRLEYAWIAAYLGSVIGMTITYWLGNRLGAPLITKYGKWVFWKSHYMDKLKGMYERHGNIVLFFSFFMPGVRQFIGYFAGIIQVPFRTFALFAYTGSALWVLGFIGLGYVFGDEWRMVFAWVERSLLYLFIAACMTVAALVLFRWRRRRSRRQEAS